MLKRTLVVIGAMSAMLLCGCGMLGGVSRDEMESVVADRDFYMEAYQDELDNQIELQDEILDLEAEVATLEEEKAELEEELAAMQSSGSSDTNGGRTVEDYYTQPFIKEALDAQIESMKESYSSTYKDLGYEVSGNTFTYWFQYADQLSNTDAVAEQLEASLTEDMLADVVADVEAECGVTGITCCYIYYNADGSIIYQDSYSTE